MLFMAPSMPRTTLAMLPVTWRMVTAVCTRLLTASRREARRSRFSFSVWLRIAFCGVVAVALLHGLLQLALLRHLVLARLGCLPLQLLGRELCGEVPPSQWWGRMEMDQRGEEEAYLEVEQGFLQAGHGRRRYLRRDPIVGSVKRGVDRRG